MKPFFIIIYGPTAVGKTDCALALGTRFPIEIINCDVGQFYEPFSIGTAKPAWRQELVPHHFFDSMTEPVDWSVSDYRARITTLIDQINARGNIPVLVGGSGFYIKSLFFPPLDHCQYELGEAVKGSWQDLHTIDPERAAVLHPNDTYRIQQALRICASGRKASECKPVFNPVSDNFLLVKISLARPVLYERINIRTKLMLDAGWIEETKKILGTKWESFLKKKKLIGYPDILEYLRGEMTYDVLVSVIQQKTRHYAKRQETFWRMLKESLEQQGCKDRIIDYNRTHDTTLTDLCNVINMVVLNKRTPL